MSSIRRKKQTWKTEKCTKQLARTVNKNAKCHSNQQKENQLDVKNALKKTGHKEASMTITSVASAVTIVDSTTDQEKCIKQLVRIAENLAKCHSSLHKENQLDVENASAHLETRNLSPFF